MFDFGLYTQVSNSGPHGPLVSSSVIYLQETFLKLSDNISFRNFNMFNYICPDGQKASGGTSIMVTVFAPLSAPGA